ncbi:hypothetical protein ACS0TY_015943 [Phlomoides rotata]
MMRLTAIVSRAMRIVTGASVSLVKPPLPPPPIFTRQFSANGSTFTPNSVAHEMIKYAASLARDQKTEESYARGLLVLEQCESTQSDGNSKGLVELARSTLLFERGSRAAAMESLRKLQHLEKLQDLSFSLGIKVAASEALAGILLELYQDDVASLGLEVVSQFLGSIRQEIGGGGGFEVLEGRIRTLKGLIELLSGNLESAQSIFEGVEVERYFSGKVLLNKKCHSKEPLFNILILRSVGNAALSCGEYLHGKREFSSAKELYRKVIQAMSDFQDVGDPNNLGACNMTSEEVGIAASCALGQLESHLGNFIEAEEILTTTLKKTEEHFGPQHPKVGVVLTCIALMYRLKSTVERSSSLLIQEGLFRKAIDLLKAPPLDENVSDENVYKNDIIALARGGYAETLLVQQSRKAEGERLKEWAESCWSNRWVLLSEALELSESSPRVLVIDTRICRAV